VRLSNEHEGRGGYVVRLLSFPVSTVEVGPVEKGGAKLLVDIFTRMSIRSCWSGICR
jgi:hypothetical protein